MDLDRVEMEYVDGGVYVTNRWYGTDFWFSPSECGDIAAILATTTGAGAVATGIALSIPGINAVVVPILTIASGMMGIGSGLFWLGNSNHKMNFATLHTFYGRLPGVYFIAINLTEPYHVRYSVF